MRSSFSLYFVHTSAFLVFLFAPATASATAPPEQVATVVVHGFDPDGVSSTGTFGADSTSDYITDMAAVLGLPLSLINPTAQNQVAHATYYGDTYPAYYTLQDQQDITAAPAGVPRYARIMAKYAKHVMQRSGAKQVNLVAVSFGGLISRYMIEKDVEGLASSGKIARWICIEGVVAGNWAATNGGTLLESFFQTEYGAPLVDLQQMRYEWVTTNLNNPRTTTISPYFGQFPVHFWQACRDDDNDKLLTTYSGKANDGVVLIEDAIFQTLPAQSKYLNLMPTLSGLNETHEGTKTDLGIRAGVAAQVFGRKRVTITLTDVRVINSYEIGPYGQGEYVFGARIFSPRAQTQYGIADAVSVRRANMNNVEYIQMPTNTTVQSNIVWFDDMVLPGETSLSVQSLVDEVDNNLIYGINETAAPDDVHQAMANATVDVSTVTAGTYPITTADWTGNLSVAITDYPPFESNSAVNMWSLY